MFISVIVPCFNEEAVLEQTHQRLLSVLTKQENISFEVIYVDDGSVDGTPALLHRFIETGPNVRLLRLSRNFGHQIAIMAGLEYAGGDAVITIDADLQDPPESIPEMIDRWQSGFDVVYGIRTGRPGESAFKIWTARLFYGLIARIADIRIPREAGDFRLMDKSVVEVLRAMPERDRFTRGLTSWAGFEQVAVPFSRSARVAGKSKYSTKRMVRFAMDAITSFSTLPLRLAMWSGFLFLGLALITIIVAASLWLLRDVNISGSILTIVAVFLIGGIQLVCLGIMGEYLGRIHGESKRRPLYILKERLGFEENAELKASVLKSGSRFTRS